LDLNSPSQRSTIYRPVGHKKHCQTGIYPKEMPMTDDLPQQTARRVGERLFANDWASRALGMQLLEVMPGEALLTMVVRQDMLNGHQTCHGGMISALADSAFAFACNSYGDMTVASGFSIEFMAPARQGDLLTARCAEVSRAGRTGVYDTDVTNQRGERIAVFRGRSYTLKGKPTVAPDLTARDNG
jgi:acyl-CoA thioesterase